MGVLAASFDILSNHRAGVAEAVAALESCDTDFDTPVQEQYPGKKFSWLVLGKYYEICHASGLVYDGEHWDAEWSRHHLDRAPHFRMRAVLETVNTFTGGGTAIREFQKKIIEKMVELIKRICLLECEYEHLMTDHENLQDAYWKFTKVFAGVLAGDTLFGAIS